MEGFISRNGGFYLYKWRVFRVLGKSSNQMGDYKTKNIWLPDGVRSQIIDQFPPATTNPRAFPVESLSSDDEQLSNICCWYVDTFWGIMLIFSCWWFWCFQISQKKSFCSNPPKNTTGHSAATCNIHPGVPRSHLKTRRMRKMVAFWKTLTDSPLSNITNWAASQLLDEEETGGFYPVSPELKYENPPFFVASWMENTVKIMFQTTFKWRFCWVCWGKKHSWLLVWPDMVVRYI